MITALQGFVLLGLPLGLALFAFGYTTWRRHKRLNYQPQRRTENE